jgi:signal transduction histidine kinase
LRIGLPRSLFGRLFATSMVALLAVLAFAALAIGNVLERIVVANLDARLDAQIAALAPAVRPDGTVDAAKLVSPPPFDGTAGGWGWEIRASGEVRRSVSGATANLGHVEPRRGGRREGRRFRSFPTREELGPVRGRMTTIGTSAGPVAVIAVAPRRLVARPIIGALEPFLTAMGLLAVAMGVALFFILHVGLKPVRRIEAMVAEVRDGRRERVEIDGPSELVPLATQLNALIDANARTLDGARRQASDLAHALKTPLARLRLSAAERGEDEAMAIDAMDRLIRRHLSRARTAPTETATLVPLRAAVRDVGNALKQIHAERGIAFKGEIDDALQVRFDGDDLSELLGNLLDNAFRWARTSVTVSGATSERRVVLTIADDGPGIPADELEAMQRPGARLDERADSHGLGLAIARELAEANGTELSLTNRPEGGLSVRLAFSG